MADEALKTHHSRPRRRRPWYSYYLAFLALLLLTAAVAAWVLSRQVPADTWRTIYNTYFDPDAATRM